MGKLRYIISIGLGAATLAVVLTYVLGAPALLQTAQAEEGHELFMSFFMPVIQAIAGGHSSMARMHGGGSGIRFNDGRNVRVADARNAARKDGVNRK